MHFLLNCFLPPFAQAQARVRKEKWFTADWQCKSGLWPNAAEPNCVVLKLLRAHWTHDPPDAIVSRSGLFFSAWVGADSIQAGKLNYNIHAFKLRKLKNYRLESRKFAEKFRAQFQPLRAQWPNVRTDFGSLTLMEGWVPATPADCEERLLNLATAFRPLAEIIEGLLEEKKRS